MLKGKPRELAIALHQVGVLQFGLFKLKSGLESPFYVDLRLLVSFPETLALCADVLAEMIAGVQYDRLAAIPYAGLPICTALSLRVGKPMIYTRREIKDYGTRKSIEGIYHPGEIVLVIDDLITTGASKLEVIAPLLEAGLKVKDIAIVLDRESGGKQALAALGYTAHAALGLTEMLDTLQSVGRLETAQRIIMDEWLLNH